jgi:hypothetical protein
MRLVPVALILGLVALAPSSAAQPSTSFEELGRHLRAGSKVRVEDRSGATTTGRFAALTADEIVVDTGSGRRRFPRDAVATVAVRRSYGRMGLLIGAGVGAALCIPCVSGENADKDAPVLTGLIGAGIGGIAGALIPRMRTEYRAPDAPPSLVVAPAMSRRGTGIRVVLRW